MNPIKGYLRKNGTVLASMLVMGALLPAVIWGVISGQSGNLVSRASQYPELYIWIEPKEVVAESGVKITFKVKASYDSETPLPQTKGEVYADDKVILSGKSFDFREAYFGSVTLYEFEASANETGKYDISVPEESVFTGLPDIRINTSGATLVVR